MIEPSKQDVHQDLDLMQRVRKCLPEEFLERGTWRLRVWPFHLSEMMDFFLSHARCTAAAWSVYAAIAFTELEASFSLDACSLPMSCDLCVGDTGAFLATFM